MSDLKSMGLELLVGAGAEKVGLLNLLPLPVRVCSIIAKILLASTSLLYTTQYSKNGKLVQ